VRSTGFAITIAVLLLAGAGSAQQATVPAPPASPAANPAAGAANTSGVDLGAGALSSDGGPVEIDASDGIEWRQDEKVYIARGNARAVRGDTSISADSLIAHYREDATGKTNIYMVEAVGHVVIVSKDARIVGDNAIYNLGTGSAIITGSNLRASSKDQYVTARDSLEYWEKQNAVVARGKAVAGAPNQEVKADMLTGYFHLDKTGTKKLYQVEATGNVILTSKGSIVHSSKAIYNVESDVATLEGGVKITRGKNQINGEHAVYNLKTGQAKITGGGKQVKTLLVPGSDNSGPLSPDGDGGGPLAP
jgi:lipopolysaccharide export system protein LptA